MTEDNDEDWGLRFVEQDEGFDEVFENASVKEREKVTCYYKLIKRLPDIEYEAKCAECDGFPLKEGCVNYITKDHIDSFPKKYSLSPPECNLSLSDVPDIPLKTLDDIGSWQGKSGFGN
jgi:hypothetical protein